MAYLVDGQGDLWSPSGEYTPDGAILWQLASLMGVQRRGGRTPWIPIRKETIERRYGGARVYGVGTPGTAGSAESHSAG